jgi:4-carboxymuconolactone decarboxylase
MDNYQNMMTKNKIVQTAGEEYLGTVIHIPANVKHWHGAAADSWFAHLAFDVPGENKSNEWLEPVSDEEYSRLATAK